MGLALIAEKKITGKDVDGIGNPDGEDNHRDDGAATLAEADNVDAENSKKMMLMGTDMDMDEKKLNRERHIATWLLLVYLVGYVGINLFTMGQALNILLGVDIWLAAAGVAAI